MKLAFPVATPEVRAPILGAKDSLGEILPALRDAGYEAIEPFLCDPDKFAVESWARVVERSGMSVAAVGTGPMVFDDRLSFTAAEPALRRAAIDRAKAGVRFAARLGAQLNVGKLRGEISATMPQESWDWMRAAFAEVCEEAGRHRIAVTIEPQGRPTINNFNSTVEALDRLAVLRLPNLHVMLDTYHMAVEGEDIAAGFAAAAARGALLHVHFADTDRLAPGEGRIDFRSAIGALRALRYDRAITLEIKPLPDALSAARRAASYLRPLLAA